jgi:threonyl-tRNA synthetase
MVVVGDKEVASQTVAVRGRGGADLGSMGFEGLVGILENSVAERT